MKRRHWKFKVAMASLEPEKHCFWIAVNVSCTCCMVNDDHYLVRNIVSVRWEYPEISKNFKFCMRLGKRIYHHYRFNPSFYHWRAFQEPSSRFTSNAEAGNRICNRICAMCSNFTIVSCLDEYSSGPFNSSFVWWLRMIRLDVTICDDHRRNRNHSRRCNNVLLQRAGRGNLGYLLFCQSRRRGDARQSNYGT